MLSSRSFMVRRASIYVWVVVVFVASELLARYLGIRFAAETLGTLYQYLDPETLRGDLLRGLFYLHSQPPLFNAFLGVVLKWFPQSYGAVFSFLFGAVALFVLGGTAWLMRRLQIPDVVSGVFLLSFAMSPAFPVYRNWLFYTLPVAALLVAAAIAWTRYLETQSNRWLAAFFTILTAVMMIRSVFHPLWLVVVALALVPFVDPVSRKRFLLWCAVPVVLINLLFLKNLLLVGSYSGSTWLGLSLTKRWPLSQREVRGLKDDGTLPEFWQRRPFQEPGYYQSFGFFGGDDHAEGHPAMDALFKSDGEPNFNHRDYVSVSDELLEADKTLILRYPGRYLRRVATSLMLYLQPGPNSVHFLVDYDFERVHRYRDAWTQYVFLGGAVERPIRMLAPPPNVWMIVFPLIYLVGLWGEPRGVFVFLLVTIAWVTGVTNLIEIGENDRMRWEVEPFLVILLAYSATRGLLFLGRLKRA